MTSPEPTLVNIGTHSLALYAHGSEPSSSKDPVVLFVSGVSCSSLIWAAVIRQLSPAIRSYTYDRSGFSNSELSPLAPTAENIALELSLLIEKAPILNPLILVGHSWAGVLINEYVFRTDGQTIAGVVLVDANHETKPLVLNVNDPVMWDLFKGIDPYEGMGLNAEHKFTKDEWEAFRRDEKTERYFAAAEMEEAEYALSFETLRKKELNKRQLLLGDKPVYVIGGMRSRDWGRMYDMAVARGNGTEEQRTHVRELIRTADEKSAGLMREFLKLSSTSKLVFAYESGHCIQLTQPEIVVDGVKWVLDHIEASSQGLKPGNENS